MNMTLQLSRNPAPKGKARNGILYLPQSGLAIPTLENEDYLIPAGRYPLRLTYSPKFGKFLPEIADVPGRSGIRIHRGTQPGHSRGCVLLKTTGQVQTVINLIQHEYAQIEIS